MHAATTYILECLLQEPILLKVLLSMQTLWHPCHAPMGMLLRPKGVAFIQHSAVCDIDFGTVADECQI